MTLGETCEQLWTSEPFGGLTEQGMRARRRAADHYLTAGVLEQLVRVAGGFAGSLVDLGRGKGTAGFKAERRGDKARAVELYGEAADAYSAAIDLTGSRPYALHYRALNRLRASALGGPRADKAETLGDLRSAAETASRHPWYWHRFARFLAGEGKVDEAIEAARTALGRVNQERARDELIAPVLAALRSKGAIRSALELAEETLRATPRGSDLAFAQEYALLLRIAKRNDVATRYLSGRLARLADAEGEELRDLLARWLTEDGRHAEAKRWTREPEGVTTADFEPVGSASRFREAAENWRVLRSEEAQRLVGRWLLIKEGKLVGSGTDPVELTRRIPAPDRWQYLTVFQGEEDEVSAGMGLA